MFCGKPTRLFWILQFITTLTFFCFVFKLPFGIQAAACARVGNALGAGDTGRAILTCKVALSLACNFELSYFYKLICYWKNMCCNVVSGWLYLESNVAVDFSLSLKLFLTKSNTLPPPFTFSLQNISFYENYNFLITKNIIYFHREYIFLLK